MTRIEADDLNENLEIYLIETGKNMNNSRYLKSKNYIQALLILQYLMGQNNLWKKMYQTSVKIKDDFLIVMA